MISLRPARNALHQQHHAQRYDDIHHGSAARGDIEFHDDITPSFAGPIFLGEMTKQLSHVGECDKVHDAGDGERLR